jgi:hypothetical protein
MFFIRRANAFGGFFQPLGERPVEFLQDVLPVFLALLDFVQFSLDVSGEADVHDFGEILHENPIQQLSEFGGFEAALLSLDVLSIHDRFNDTGIGGGTADTAILEFLDKRSVVIPGRGTSEMLFGFDFLKLKRRPFGQGGKQLVLGIVFGIQPGETVEDQNRTGHAEHKATVSDLDGRGFILGGLHLTGDKPPPDQVVEPELIPGKSPLEFLGRTHRVRGRIASCASCASLDFRRPWAYREDIFSELPLDKVSCLCSASLEILVESVRI